MRTTTSLRAIARYCLLGSLGATVLLLGGCANPNHSRYNYYEVGKTTVVYFGTVVGVRPIEITGRNTGLGAAAGAAGGGIAGSTMGRGSGNAAAIVGGVLIGAAAGALAEQALADRSGLEYTVVLENGKTITVAQEQAKDDRVFASGDRVMVQSSGSYQRVLPTDHIPTEINRPQGIKIIDPAPTVTPAK